MKILNYLTNNISLIFLCNIISYCPKHSWKYSMARPLKKSIFSPYAAYNLRSNKEKKIKKSSSTKSLSDLYKRKKSTTKRSIKKYNKLKKSKSRAKSTYVGLSKNDAEENNRHIKFKLGTEFLRLPRINNKSTNNSSNISNKNSMSASYLLNKNKKSSNSLYLSSVSSSSSTSSYSSDIKSSKNSKEIENYQTVIIDNGDLIEKIARESSFYDMITDTKTRLEKIKINNF